MCNNKSLQTVAYNESVIWVRTIEVMQVSKLQPLVFRPAQPGQAQTSRVSLLLSCLRRDFAASAKHVPELPILCGCLLQRGWESEETWPLEVVEAFLEDSLGHRIWVGAEVCV